VKNIFHMSKDHYPCPSCNQSIPAFTEATREKDEKNKTSYMLGAAQQNTQDHAGGGECYDGWQKPVKGHREKAH
jgi:hypothetical protein